MQTPRSGRCKRLGAADANASGLLRGRLATRAPRAQHFRMDADPRDRVDSARLDDIERRAIAAYLSGDDETSEALWQRAHTECVRANELERAARAAFWLILDLFNSGEWERGNGWLT